MLKQWLSRLYDEYLARREDSLRERAVRSVKASDRIKELRASRAEVAWRWEDDGAFKRRVGRMSAKEFKRMKDAFPDFVERVGQAFRHTPYGVNPKLVWTTGHSNTMALVGTQRQDLQKDLKEFRELNPIHRSALGEYNSHYDLAHVYAQSPMLPSAENTVVPGTNKTFAEMGLDIDSQLVAEPQAPADERVDVAHANDVVDSVPLSLLNHRSDDPEDFVKALDKVVSGQTVYTVPLHVGRNIEVPEGSNVTYYKVPEQGDRK